MLRLKKISKRFNSGTSRELQVLENVCFEAMEGELTVLLGGNGAGKSTLLRIISGELPPDGGSVWLDGTDVTSWPAYLRATRVAHIYQSRESNLAENLTVAETFALVMSRSAPWHTLLTQRRWRKSIYEILATAKPGLEARIDDQIRSLSGGEHQIIAILTAREMVHSAAEAGGVILLDEHMAYLDPLMTEVVLRLTKELSCQQKFTVLMVTHDIHVAAKYGDRILVLKDRRIVFDKRYTDGVERVPEELFRILG